jgi:hypothetical protein
VNYLLLKTCFENSVKLDVSRVTGFPEFPNKRIHGFCDVKDGHHLYIGQGRRHWAMAKEEGIDVI